MNGADTDDKEVMLKLHTTMPSIIVSNTWGRKISESMAVATPGKGSRLKEGTSLGRAGLPDHLNDTTVHTI